MTNPLSARCCRPLDGLPPLLLLCLLSPSVACPYAIRDAGFIVTDPAPYRIIFFVPETASAGALRDAVETASESWLADANVVAEVVDPAGEPDPEDLHQRGQVVLLSPDGRVLPLAEKGAPLTAEDVALTIREVVVSPLREKFLAASVAAWCTVLLVEGPSETANARARDAIRQAGEAVVGEVTEMEQVIGEQPRLLTVAAGDPAERVLLWSLELDEPLDETRAAVVFGTGRRLGEILSLGEIEPANLAERFRLLGRNCSCTMDPQSILGPALPLPWDVDQQTLVRDRLGFDPNSPAAAMTLAQTWTPRRGAAAAPQPYDLGEVELGSDPPVVSLRPSPGHDAARAVLRALGTLALLAIAGAGAVLLLRRREG